MLIDISIIFASTRWPATAQDERDVEDGREPMLGTQ
jgi:hypothetical protein